MKRIVPVALIALGIWFYFTPHLAVRGMQAAVHERDAARLASYIDFPALREDLKASLGARLQAELTSKTSSSGHDLPAVFGAAMLTTVMNPVIDAIVTPEGLARIMAGERLLTPKERRQTKEPDTQPSTAPRAESVRPQPQKLTMHYEGFDRFVAKAKHKDGPGEPAALLFTRVGLFSWKLAGIRLPQ